MDGIKVLGCGYREWAKQIFSHINKDRYYRLDIIADPKDLTIHRLAELKPDVILFYGWSWRIPEDITSRFMCLCLHPSPLPKYRGGSPIQNQMMRGETESAVSIFRMNGEIDAGQLCYQSKIFLHGTLAEIMRRIQYTGVSGSNQILKDLQNGGIQFWNQEGEPTYFPRRKPSESRITLEDLDSMNAEDLYNKIRGLQEPYPQVYIECRDGERLYIEGAHL